MKPLPVRTISSASRFVSGAVLFFLKPLLVQTVIAVNRYFR